MRSRILGFTGTLLCLIFLLSSCGTSSSGRTSPTSSSTNPRKMQLVVTTTQLRDFASIIAGSRATVQSILQPGEDPHNHALTPNNITAIANADLVIANGVGLDAWLTERWSDLDHRGPLIDASRGIAFRNTDAFGRGENDPHYWMNPQNVKLMVATIRDALNNIDPKGAGIYEANERAYSARLQQLSNELHAALLPMRSVPFLVSHNALGYFAAEYQLDVIGATSEGFGTTQNLSEQSRQQLVTKARDEKAKMVFVVDKAGISQSQAVANQLEIPCYSQENGLFADSLGDKGSGAETYVSAMQKNTEHLLRASNQS